MTKNEQVLYLILSLVLVLLFFLSINNSTIKNNDLVFNISVIINEGNDENYKIFKNGVDKGSSDYNVDVNFVTLYDSYSITQQINLIKREIDNGADGLIIVPVNPDEVSFQLSNMKIHIPVIFVNSDIKNAVVKNYVTYYEHSIIKGFIKDIINENENMDIILVSDVINGKTLSKLNSLIINVLDSNNRVYDNFYYSNTDDLNTFFNNKEFKKNETLIIALNEINLDRVGNYYANLNKDEIPNIYGIGFNDSIIYHLENNIIKKILAPDYYGLGYESVKITVDAIREVHTNELIVFSKPIGCDEIFNTENQMLLFPIQ